MSSVKHVCRTTVSKKFQLFDREDDMDKAEICETLKAMMVRRLSLRIKPEDIDDDKPLFRQTEGAAVEGGLELDSVEALEIIVGIEECFGVSVPPGDYVDEFYSVASVADFVMTLRETQEAA